MLRIREEQIRILRESLDERLITGVVHLLQQHWPRRSARLGTEALREFVLDTIHLCGVHGLKGEQHIFRLANIRMALLPEAPEDIAWMQSMLEDSRFRPPDRLDRVAEETSAYLERRYGAWDS